MVRGDVERIKMEQSMTVTQRKKNETKRFVIQKSKTDITGLKRQKSALLSPGSGQPAAPLYRNALSLGFARPQHSDASLDHPWNCGERAKRWDYRTRDWLERQSFHSLEGGTRACDPVRGRLRPRPATDRFTFVGLIEVAAGLPNQVFAGNWPGQGIPGTTRSKSEAPRKSLGRYRTYLH